jgi:large subunit ribosomal protein L3
MVSLLICIGISRNVLVIDCRFTTPNRGENHTSQAFLCLCLVTAGRYSNRVKALITRKIGMTSAINEDGVVVPVTLLAASDNTVTQVKTTEADGYTALQLGFEQAKNLVKPLAGHLKKAKTEAKVMREIRIDELPEDLGVGATIAADVFSVGDKVDVTGTSKGKGWAGTIKRHNFRRQRQTHGAKGNTRKVGSIGSMYPQRIFKGKKMAGQMGHEKVTVKNLTIAIVDMENKVIGVQGAVPGPNKSLVLVKGVK